MLCKLSVGDSSGELAPWTRVAPTPIVHLILHCSMLASLRVLLLAPLALASTSAPRLRAAHPDGVQRQRAADSVRSEPAALRVSSGTLYGTLEMPARVPRPPVVLIISGSGPTDRNGNNALLPGRNDALALLADSLAERGIASLRYDKRGIAASAAALESEENLTIDTHVNERARLAMLPGMNHVLKTAPAERSAQMPAYTDPAVPLAPGLVDAVASFLQQSLRP